MRFTLVFNGNLPSAGNRAKPEDVARIRAVLSPQMEMLWRTHHALQVLRDEGFTPKPTSGVSAFSSAFSDIGSPREIEEQYPGSMIDLCTEIAVGPKLYKPLVRSSLHLNCNLSILFLRQDDPGALRSQGGDLDGRIKCLLDALRVPSFDEQNRAMPSSDQLHVLMEEDALVAGLEVRTERLLFPETTHQHEVFLVVEVTVNVLRVRRYNTCLL